MNTVMIVGKLSSDIRGGMTQKGDHWASCSISVGKKVGQDWKNMFFDISAFKQQAERLKKAVKGDRIMVMGQLDVNEYKNKEGKDVKKVQIVAREVFVESKSSAEKLGFDDEPQFKEESFNFKDEGFDGL